MRLFRGLEWREMAGLGLVAVLRVAIAFSAAKEAFTTALSEWGRDA